MTDISRLAKAIYDEGPRPDVHRSIMARHRREWPTLWAAIDSILAENATSSTPRLINGEPVKPGQTEETWGW